MNGYLDKVLFNIIPTYSFRSFISILLFYHPFLESVIKTKHTTNAEVERYMQEWVRASDRIRAK